MLRPKTLALAGAFVAESIKPSSEVYAFACLARNALSCLLMLRCKEMVKEKDTHRVQLCVAAGSAIDVQPQDEG
jgi:hypothetical protein